MLDVGGGRGEGDFTANMSHAFFYPEFSTCSEVGGGGRAEFIEPKTFVIPWTSSKYFNKPRRFESRSGTDEVCTYEVCTYEVCTYEVALTPALYSCCSAEVVKRSSPASIMCTMIYV